MDMLTTQEAAVNPFLSINPQAAAAVGVPPALRGATFWVVETQFGPTRQEWEAELWREAQELRQQDQWLMHQELVIGDSYGVNPDDDPDFWAECEAAGWH